MGGGKSKTITYSVGIPESDELEYSPILRHPDANDIIILPKIWGCSSYYSLFLNVANKYPDRPFIAHRWSENSDFEWLSYNKSAVLIGKIACNLVNLGFRSDEFLTKEYKKPLSLLGFLGKTSIEWILTEIACMSTKIVSVGLLDDYSTFISWSKTLNLKYIFCAENWLGQILEAQVQGLISLESVIFTGKVSQEIWQAYKNAAIRLISFEELASGETRLENEKIEPNDPYCLSPTSGTTGDSKFCITSHLNLMATLSSCLYISKDFSTEDSYLSYLNFSFMSEKVFVYLISASGGKIGIAFSPTEFRKDARYLKPTLMITVPRMLEYFYENIKSEVDKLSGLSRSLYNKAYSSKLKTYEKTGNLKHKIWDSLVFKKARKTFGGELKVLLVGAGRCNKEVIRFLRIVLGCQILEGYSLTEATSACLCTLPYDTNSGYMGGPILNLEVRLKFTSLALEEHTHYYGELCVRGPSVCKKYYGSHESLVDSSNWLRTGDLVALIPETGALEFIDRIEYIAKARSGRAICIQKLELLYRQCNIIAQILCVGDQRIEGIVAVIVPDKHFVSVKWKEVNIDSFCKTSDFATAVLREFLVIERIHKLKEHEKILKVHVELSPWVTKDLITPNLKQRRYRLIEKYSKEINEMVEQVS